MGSGDWFRTIISRKKRKEGRSKKVKGSNTELLNGLKVRNHTQKDSNKLYSVSSSGNPDVPIEDISATHIQAAFRGYKARKKFRSLKGTNRLQVLTQCHSVTKQASTALTYIQSWSKIQAQISARRLYMVTEGRIRQKKEENQLKLEAKLHDLEVEWSGGSETMEEVIARIQQREEAAFKRERAMAYAFSHQWRANSGQNQGQFVYDIGKGDWGWSWMDRWVAARPWETRIPAEAISPKKGQIKPLNKVSKNTNPPAQRVSSSVKPAASNGKESVRRLPNPAAAKASQEQQVPSQKSEVAG